MIRKLIHLIMLLCISTQVFAYDFSKKNSDGKTIYYNITSTSTPKTVAVTDHDTYYYSGEIKIPSSVTYNGVTYSVTGIGEYAFYYCSNLTSVTIPASITYVGLFAFFVLV